MNLYHTLSSIQCYIKPPWSNILRLYMPTKHSPSASISAGRKAVFANVGLNCCGKEMPQLGLKHTHTHTHTHTKLLSGNVLERGRADTGYPQETEHSKSHLLV